MLWQLGHQISLMTIVGTADSDIGLTATWDDAENVGLNETVIAVWRKAKHDFAQGNNFSHNFYVKKVSVYFLYKGLRARGEQYASRTHPIYLLEFEETLRVVIADVFNHLVDTFCLIAGIRNQAVLDVLANKVAEGTTEVLMTWV